MAVDGWVSLNVNQSLVYYYQGKLYPGLATKWTSSADAKTWTLKLRKGVKFQDGTPFNAAAVKASFDHVVDPATKSRSPLAMLGPYDGATIVGDYTVEIHFKTPNVGFKYAIANIVGGMNSPTALKATSPANYARKPVGAGPYKIDSFVYNQQIVLSAFNDYDWAPEFMGASGPAPVKKMSMRILPGWKMGSDGVREKGGKKLELQLINIAGFGFDQMTQLLQAQVKKAGFSVKITSESFPTLAATMNAGAQNLGDLFYFSNAISKSCMSERMRRRRVGFCVARAISRWNCISSCRKRSSLARKVGSAASARCPTMVWRIASRCSSLARRAAS